MSVHTWGCLSATAGLIATTQILTSAQIVAPDVEPAAATKVLHAYVAKGRPVGLATLSLASVAAFVQATKTPATKPWWIAAGALFGSFFPWTLGYVMRKVTPPLTKAGEEGVAADPKDLKRFHQQSLARGAVLGAATVVAIVALSKKQPAAQLAQ